MGVKIPTGTIAAASSRSSLTGPLSHLRASAALSLALACISSESPSNGPVFLRLMDVAHIVAHSENNSITLITEQQACIIDSYEVRVMCGDRQWRTTQSYGGQGEGPGQFRQPAALIRLAAGQIGVVDLDLQRLTILPGTETVRVPPLFRPLAGIESDTLVAGLFESFSRDRTTVNAAWLSLSSDSLLNRVAFRYQPSDDWPIRPFLIGGTTLGDGDFVFNISNRAVVRYGPDGALIGEFDIPEREPVYPSEEDVRRRAQDIRRIFGETPRLQELETFAETAKAPLLPWSPVLVGPDDFIFIGSSRDRETHSYIDVLQDGRQVGTLRVRGRLLSFDVLDDTLATLVERTGQADEDGLTPRGIDWYQIEVH